MSTLCRGRTPGWSLRRETLCSQLSYLSESPPVNPDMVAKYREVYKEDHQVNLIDDQSTGIGVPNDSRKNLTYCVEIYAGAGKVLAAKKKRDGTGYLGTYSNSDKQQGSSTNVLERLR